MDSNCHTSRILRNWVLSRSMAEFFFLHVHKLMQRAVAKVNMFRACHRHPALPIVLIDLTKYGLAESPFLSWQRAESAQLSAICHFTCSMINIT
jgi:hypothetical protein